MLKKIIFRGFPFLLSILAVVPYAAAEEIDLDANGNGVIELADLITRDQQGALTEAVLESLFTNADYLTQPSDFMSVGESQFYTGYPIGRPGDVLFNSLVNSLWGGKTFHYNDVDDVTLDNKILPNPLLMIDMVTAQVYPVAESLYDKHPAIMLDYSDSEVALLRGVRDEIRLVDANSNLYIGRANVQIASENDSLLDYSQSVVLIDSVNLLMQNGHNCRQESGVGLILPVIPRGTVCFGLWFALQKSAE